MPKSLIGEWKREGDPQPIPESLTIHARTDGGFYAYAAYEIVESRMVGEVREVRSRRETFEAFYPEDVKDGKLAVEIRRLMEIAYTAHAGIIQHVFRDPSGKLRVRKGDEPKNST